MVALAKERGFTIVELLLSMGIIALLAAIVLVAINPTRQLAQGRNAARRSDTTQILKAIQQYRVANDSSLPTGLDSTLRMLGTDGSGCDVACGGTATAAACLDFSDELVPEYLASIPFDSLNGNQGQTYYAVELLGDDRIAVRACSAEQGESIVVSQ